MWEAAKIDIIEKLIISTFELTAGKIATRQYL